MEAVGPLFAAGGDWVDLLLPALFAIFWLVGQVMTVLKRARGDGARPAAVPPRPPRQPVAVDPPADVRGQLERQIEEFLRQTRGGPPPPRPTPPKPESRMPPRPAAPKAERPQSGGRSVAKQPVRPVAKAAKPAGRLADRALAPLGAAGDDVVGHVQEAFANDLGHRDPMLAPPAVAKRAAGGAAADELAKTLHDPALLRRLIVMREILDRPVDRWE